MNRHHALLLFPLCGYDDCHDRSSDAVQQNQQEKTLMEGTQADANGLFMPAAAEGTWVMCHGPDGADVKPVYVEPRVVISPSRSPA